MWKRGRGVWGEEREWGWEEDGDLDLDVRGWVVRRLVGEEG